MENDYYEFENTPLPYEYDALEPFIDTKTMKLHHDKHLQTYINNLNAILKMHPDLQKLSLEQLIIESNKLPEHIAISIRNNAGGVYNHRFFFEGLAKEKHSVGKLNDDIIKTYGSIENFKDVFKKAALGVFGSGYAWLIVDNNDKLKVVTTANQDTPLTEGVSILNLDVWEHAYYLKHYNDRAKYIDNWFNIIDWEKANERYNTAQTQLKNILYRTKL